MKISTAGKTSGQLFCLQKRIVKATEYNNPNGPFVSPEKFCGGEPKWGFEDCDYISCRYCDGKDFQDLFAELRKSWEEYGVSGFFSLGYAELAKEIMENASENGKFDSCDGYNKPLYRVRHEYRIVLVEFDIKVEVC